MPTDPDKTMRICFLDVNSSYSHSSLALPMLHASCAELEFLDWQVVRGTINDDANRLATAVAELSPDIILGTAYLFNREFLLKILRRVQAMLPDCTIILGGPEFLGDNEHFLRREPTVDAVVRGEGEPALPLLLIGLNNGNWADDTPGLCRLADNAYIDNDHAVLDADDWVALPPPQRSDFAILNRPFIQIETTRGCPHRCSFCTSALPIKVRRLPLDRVRESLAIAREHNIREIRVLDRTFNAEPQRALELMHLFRDEAPDLRIHLEIHPGYLTDDLRREFAAAPDGFYHLEVGLQTTSRGALDSVNRGRTADDAWGGLAFLCTCSNLDVHVDLLAGLPDADMAQLLDDLVAVSRLAPAEIQLETLKLLPGTPIVNDTSTFGLIFSPDPPYEILTTPGFTAQDLQTVRKLSLLIDRYYNHPMLQRTTQMAIEHTADFYTDFLAFTEASTDAFTPTSLEKRSLRLHRFLQDRCPPAAARLEIDWLRHGLSPSGGPGNSVRWKSAIPSDAQLIEGTSDHGDSQTWLLKNELGRRWFIFDRAKRRQGPIAVFAAPQQ